MNFYKKKHFRSRAICRYNIGTVRNSKTEIYHHIIGKIARVKRSPVIYNIE